MNSIILDSCNELEKRLNSKQSKKEFFDSCVQKKIEKIYNRENEEYDMLLHKLEVYIDYNEPKQVEKCVSKILSVLKRNRKSLFNILKELS